MVCQSRVRLEYDLTANRLAILGTSRWRDPCLRNAIYARSTGDQYLVSDHRLVRQARQTRINIQVNNGVVDSTAYLLVPFDGVNRFMIGRYGGNYMSGRIGPTMFWKSAAAWAE